MSISAKEVAKLREMTGAGMMDCKKALTESNGDFDAAIDLLRKKGQKISAARADRDANEGVVFARTNDAATWGIMIELNCETDFVARNEAFQQMGETILNIAFENKPSDIEGLKALPMNKVTVADELTSAMGRIGEKIDVSSFEQVEGERVISYIHPGARVGVMVAFTGVGSEDTEAVGKNIAMQIAAMRPVAVDESQVSQAILDREFRIGREQAIEEGKPENIIDRVAEGKVKRFLKDNTLLNQDYVKDSSKSVATYLKETNPNLKVKAFKRVEIGGK